MTAGETTTTTAPSSSSPPPSAPSSSDLDTFHVWDGILSTTAAPSDGDEDDDGGGTPSSKAATLLTWRGTVVSYPSAPDATEVEVPKRGAFDRDVASEVKFSAEGTAVRAENESENGASAAAAAAAGADASDDEVTVYRATLTDAEDEKGDNNGDKEKGEKKKKEEKETTAAAPPSASSTKHELLLRTLRWSGNLSDQTVNLIFSRGSSSSSSGKGKKFIAAGWMRVGNRLTLGRRYLSEDDPRALWTLEELREAVIKEICSGGGVKGLGKAMRIPPWKCSVMGSTFASEEDAEEEDNGDNGGSNKRRKVEEKEAS